jgi:hypothetical protein
MKKTTYILKIKLLNGVVIYRKIIFWNLVTIIKIPRINNLKAGVNYKKNSPIAW